MVGLVPASLAFSTSSMTTAMAWVGSGAGRASSARVNSRAGVEGPGLRDRPCLDDALVLEQAHLRRHAVVAQAAGVDGIGHEVVAERVHLDDRRHLAGVAEVVGVDAAGQARRRGRLGRDDAVVSLTAQLLADEGEGQAGEVGAAAGAGHDDIGLLAGHLHLLHGLLADDRLVQEHVVEHASPGRSAVSSCVAASSTRLADGDAQRARACRASPPAPCDRRPCRSLGLATTSAPYIFMRLRRPGLAS